MRPRLTLKLGSLRTRLPVVKEFGELSTKLEFDGSDDIVTDGGQPEGKVTNRSPPGEADEGGREDVEDGKSESKPMMETKLLRLMNTNGNGK